jgi:hypothetical protein
LKACWSSDSNTTSTIKKILTGQIPKHHKKILTVTRVCRTSHSKVNESQYIWITRIAHSGNRLWSFYHVVEFVSSISFKWYRWCHRQSFDVFIEFFLLPYDFLFFFLLLIVPAYF